MPRRPARGGARGEGKNLYEAGSLNPKKTKTTETKTTANTIDENETEAEWECVPVGDYWSVHGKPKWKYIVVEKSVCQCQWAGASV